MKLLDTKAAVVTGVGAASGWPWLEGWARLAHEWPSPAGTLESAVVELSSEGLDVLAVPTDLADPMAIEAMIDAFIN